jgi:hypothetical protein
MIKSRRIRWAWRVPRMRSKGNAHRFLMGEPEGKRPQGRPTHRSENNIKMDLGEIVWGSMDWIYLAQCRDQRMTLVNTIMNHRVLHYLSDWWPVKKDSAPWSWLVSYVGLVSYWYAGLLTDESQAAYLWHLVTEVMNFIFNCCWCLCCDFLECVVM